MNRRNFIQTIAATALCPWQLKQTSIRRGARTHGYPTRPFNRGFRKPVWGCSFTGGPRASEKSKLRGVCFRTSANPTPTGRWRNTMRWLTSSIRRTTIRTAGWRRRRRPASSTACSWCGIVTATRCGRANIGYVRHQAEDAWPGSGAAVRGGLPQAWIEGRLLLFAHRLALQPARAGRIAPSLDAMRKFIIRVRRNWEFPSASTCPSARCRNTSSNFMLM